MPTFSLVGNGRVRGGCGVRSRERIRLCIGHVGIAVSHATARASLRQTMQYMVVSGRVTMGGGKILVIVTRGRIVCGFHGKCRRKRRVGGCTRYLCRRPIWHGRGVIRGGQGWVLRDIVLGNHISLLMEMCILLVLSGVA